MELRPDQRTGNFRSDRSRPVVGDDGDDEDDDGSGGDGVDGGDDGGGGSRWWARKSAVS